MANQSYSQRIEKYLREHPGATKAEARGHGKTPEHKPITESQVRRAQEKFPEYAEKLDSREKQKAADYFFGFTAEKRKENWPSNASSLFWQEYQRLARPL